MELTKTEETIIAIPEPVYKLKKVRAPERYLPNGKYNFKPLSPTYSKDYYAKMRGDVECPHCSKLFCHKDTLRHHIIRSTKCILLRENISLKAALEALTVNIVPAPAEVQI